MGSWTIKNIIPRHYRQVEYRRISKAAHSAPLYTWIIVYIDGFFPRIDGYWIPVIAPLFGARDNNIPKMVELLLPV